jgi:hypothetical protein
MEAKVNNSEKKDLIKKEGEYYLLLKRKSILSGSKVPARFNKKGE